MKNLKDFYIHLLGIASKYPRKELIEDCLNMFNRINLQEITVTELHAFCVIKGILNE